MRERVLTMAVTGLYCAFFIAGQAAGDTTAEDTLHEWAAAFSEASVEKMVGFYEDSKDVLAIQSTGRVRRGAAEIRKEYEAAFDEVIFDKVTLADLRVRQSGDVAWATCELRANTTRKSDTTGWTLRVYTSFVLKLSGDTWKIVLEQSTPIAGVARVKQRKQRRLSPVTPAQKVGG